MYITDSIKYVGVKDRKIDLFEGQYKVPDGMAYNSYVILDDKTAVFDTVDQNFTHEWLDNIENVLQGRKPDYLIVSHMEPDHSANVLKFSEIYPETKIVSNAKSFVMMKNFFGVDFADRRIEVTDGSALELGKHVLHFVTAPMVHWPEVIMTYESTEKVLFSADGFGKFGATESSEDWLEESRRYYIGIVGKYGAQVINVLNKAAALDIKIICPLHGPVLTENIGYYVDVYKKWASYTPDKEGVFIAYTSVYGHTKKAAELLKEELVANGCPDVNCVDLARTDMSKAIGLAFSYETVVFATTTYNAEIFPFMETFITGLVERNFQNKTVAFVENGSWAPVAAKVMKAKLEKCKNLTYAENTVTILSALSDKSVAAIKSLATELCQRYIAADNVKANKNDLSALFNIGYGLYVVTSGDGTKDNGLIVNTVSQVTDVPNRIAVTINKENYSHHIIKQTGKMNVNCLTTETPFEIFERFGFVSGRNVDKFDGLTPLRSDNGLIFLPRYVNSFISLKVENYVDLGTHGMFICSVEEARVLSNKETMTYAYYQANVKPKPNTEGKKGYVCKVCGYVYEGDVLPDDFICPLCKHGAIDFEKIK